MNPPERGLTRAENRQQLQTKACVCQPCNCLRCGLLPSNSCTMRVTGFYDAGCCENPQPSQKNLAAAANVATMKGGVPGSGVRVDLGPIAGLALICPKRSSSTESQRIPNEPQQVLSGYYVFWSASLLFSTTPSTPLLPHPPFLPLMSTLSLHIGLVGGMPRSGLNC